MGIGSDIAVDHWALMVYQDAKWDGLSASNEHGGRSLFWAKSNLKASTLMDFRSPRKVRTGPNGFGNFCQHENRGPNPGSGSGMTSNLEPDLGSVLNGSGSNLGSEPNSTITSTVQVNPL